MSDEVLAQIKRLAAGHGRILLGAHAKQRMRARGVSESDLVSALLSASAAIWEDGHGSWLVTGGLDATGDPLDIACDIEADLIIRTVM